MIKKIRKWAICAFCILITSFHLFGQTDEQIIDSLEEKINFYERSKASSVLFAHFDKTVYTDNENVWFTAYLLNFKKTNNPRVLSALLIDTKKRSIVLKQRFIMVNGISFGNFVIPDTLIQGSYSVLLYTNIIINKNPVDKFVQPIIIKKSATSEASIFLSHIDSLPKPIPSNQQILVRIYNNRARPMPGVPILFFLGKQPFIPTKDTAISDQNGEYILSIPDNQIKTDVNVLTVKIKDNNEYKTAQLLLEIREKFHIKFYPEGGNLVHATSNTIGWEVTQAGRGPIEAEGLLLQNDRVIDTIKTDLNGLGRFHLIPLIGSKYVVKLLAPQSDSVYSLPVIVLKGPVITIDQAIADDSLAVKLVSKIPARYYMLIHNFKKIFSFIPVEVGAAGNHLKIVLTDIQRGLAEVTILDSMSRPVAERVFFAHFGRAPKTSITIDSSVYFTRQKINLKFKVSSFGEDSTKALFSIACVQNNRLDRYITNDIASYFYLSNQLNRFPIMGNSLAQSLENRKLLENVLLIKGWRRYSWQDMVNIKPKDTLPSFVFQPAFEGVITKYGRSIKKAQSVMVMTDSVTKVIFTDQNGLFRLSGKNIMNNSGRKIHLILNDPNDEYEIKAINSFDSIDSAIIQNNKIYEEPNKSFRSFSHDLSLDNGKGTIALKTVVIRGRKENKIYDSSKLYTGETKNECGDYVCRYNYLNCQMHPNEPDNRAAIKGETYYNFAGREITYTGCIIKPPRSKMEISGINYPKEFYVSDYTNFNPSEAEYRSTIFWKHAIKVDNKGEAFLSFFTSDITGPFKIVIQGVTDNDLFYAEKAFEVIKRN